MQTLSIIILAFIYLVIGYIINEVVFDSDVVSCIFIWPFTLFVFAAVLVGCAIIDFFEDKKWRKLFNNKEVNSND